MRNRTARGLTVMATMACAMLAFASPSWAQSFTKGTEVRVDTFAPAVDLGDVNGDGDLDAVVGAHNNGPPHVRVLFGGGDGSFQLGPDNPTVTGAGGVVLGDINNDGDQDLVYAGNSGSQGSLSVSLGNGTGFFAPPTSVAVGANPGEIALADVDGDADRDVIVVSDWPGAFSPGSASGTVAVIRNNNGALAAQRASYGIGASPGKISVGDVDEDGDLDIAVSRYGADVALLTNTGVNSGAFSVGSANTGNDDTGSVVLDDFDGDGDADLAAGNANNSGGLAVALSNGSGGFGAPVMVDRRSSLRGLRAADFDGDGDKDLAAAQTSSIFVYANNGSGAFSPASSITPNPTAGLYEDLAVGNLNGDRYPDLLALRSNPDGGIIPLLANPPPNLAPVISSAEVTPLSPRPDATLTANVSSSDPNNDPVTLAYRWELENPQTGSFNPINGETGATLDLSKPGLGDPGDVIRVAVTATDSRDLSSSKDSNEVEVIDPRSRISVSSSSLDFDPRAVGSIGPTRTLTVTNTGSADPLNVGGVRRSGADPDDFMVNADDCTTGPIPTGESCRIGARFAPEAAGPRTATLTISSDAAGGPVEVTLSGAGKLVAQNDSYTTDEDETLNVPAPGILANDTDGIPLTASKTDGPADGTLTLNDDGSFEYVPDPNFNGTDSFSYRAADGTGPGANESNEARVEISVRPVADPVPDTLMDDGPSGTVGSAAAAFSFSSAQQDATFECSMDNETFKACDSPKEYANLPDGEHVFEVRAKNAAGDADDTPARRRFTVDTGAPDTTITSGPSGRTNSTSAAFDFDASETGATFECSLDGEPFAACGAPAEYAGLLEGAHDFRVRAVDAAGNRDASPATRSWSVDTTTPTVESVSPRNGAKAVSRGASVGVVFSEAMDGASVERADALTLRKQGTVKPVPATRTYDPATNSLTLDPSRALEPGATYVARIRFLATDEAGNDLKEVTAWSFTVKR